MSMKLSETVEKMVSEDYKERFIAEYEQLAIRCIGLSNMLKEWDNGELNFTPTIYNIQVKAMDDYLAVLEARAVMENIDLGTEEKYF